MVWESGAVLRRVVRESRTEKVTLGQRPEGNEVVSHAGRFQRSQSKNRRACRSQGFPLDLILDLHKFLVLSLSSLLLLL